MLKCILDRAQVVEDVGQDGRDGLEAIWMMEMRDALHPSWRIESIDNPSVIIQSIETYIENHFATVRSRVTRHQ
jgi:hypothetical protein